MTEKRCKTYKIKMKLQIKYVDLIHIIHITYSSGHGYYYYDQNQHAVSGSSAGHQFRILLILYDLQWVLLKRISVTTSQRFTENNSISKIKVSCG